MQCREITRNSSDELNRDTSGTKQIAEFLKEMSEAVPNEVFPSINLILGQLDVEVRTNVSI